MDSPPGYDSRVWRALAAELGVLGVAVPDEFGGAGAGMRELAVVFEETGAALLCAPLYATAGLAIPALLASGDREAMADLLPGVVDGSTIATVVFNDALTAWDPAAVTLTAHRTADGHRVNGSAATVLDGHNADLILVAARTGAGLSLLAVRADAPGLDRRPLAGLDRTRRTARLRFDDVPARLIGADGAAEPWLARTYQLGLTALAAEQVGGAQRCLDMAVDYAKHRIQFGRPIGSFQAVKHRCADMLVAVEGARSAAVHAAEAADGHGDLPTAAAVAKMVCSDAYLQAALDNLRIHGGIGFTWEHDAHLYVRRAKAAQLMFGGPDLHAQHLAELIGTPGKS
ncbi:acyl-CoA dehydrogenase domain-containing protein [Mycolicibacterium thermoresistibile ATCC 19527]|uniref:Acyl-CoA dehydrogenase domain-containing protein n=3 Tax=Mycolicibacterium thermoresistibile TaxID=1797 RepID=G7CN47_MYCT3|nr:acyl-CoA dehydrogenase domain-containing protein [Mycolicibacterium thermoresistibile ATCC 19527]GAT15412.1 acyl-CoA dehydrogenase [Mycolicibacterium thermoresistibile]SNW17471.1 acyl-CoA dehydrogenase [Mycolicibacterium thermoresistibile]